MGLIQRTRRAFLEGAGGLAVVGVAGCLGGGVADEERPPGVSEAEFERGPVPEAYRTATSQGGERRDPDRLVTKQAAKFQEADETVEAGLAEAGQRCANCHEFIPDVNRRERRRLRGVRRGRGLRRWRGLVRAVGGARVTPVVAVAVRRVPDRRAARAPP